MGGIVWCCGLPFLALVVALVGSTLLRAAVAAANRALGPAAPPDAFGQWDDWDSDEPPPKPRKADARKVPEPGLVAGTLVVFAAGLVDAAGLAFLSFLLTDAFDFGNGPDDDDRAVAAVLVLLFGVPASVLVHVALVVWFLPTTFARAALVALFYHLIAAAIFLAFGVAGALVWYLTGP